LEVLFCTLTTKHGVAPPTINYCTPDPECDLDYTPNNAREIDCRFAMNNNFGFGGQNVANLMERFGVDDDIPIEAGIVSKSIENAQTKVEGHNFDIRKHLLKYDDVINQQREVTYAERRRILTSTSLRESLQRMVDTYLSGLVYSFTAGDDPEEWDLAALHSSVRTVLPLPPTLTSNSWANMAPDQIEDQILEMAGQEYEQMEQKLGSDFLRWWEKAVMLQTLDTLWVRHLTALDALRQGIGLRAFGQQDPLVAFQKEAFEMYNQLKAAVQEEVVRKIYHPELAGMAMPAKQAEQKEEEADRVESAAQMRWGGLQARNLQAVHPSAMAASQAEADTPGATKQAPEPVRVKKMPGRNDPCWCGSGKKYKQCHMRSDNAGGNGSDTPAAAKSASRGSRPGSKRKKRTKARRR
jgi:preprotein translocase subunit SecA